MKGIRFKSGRLQIAAARVISILFSPFLFATMVFVLMFKLTYLSLLPFSYKAYVLACIVLFTALLPVSSIYFYGRLLKLPKGYLSVKENRLVPYSFTLISYFFGYLLMQRLMLPYYMVNMLLVVLVVMLVCALANIKWKISEHMAVAGAATGCTLLYAPMFTGKALWWFCAVVMLSGLLGTARMTLRKDSLRQVFVGWIAGIVCCAIVLARP